MTAPTFLHLGPGKAGSTWVHETLLTHPEVYLTPAKDLYFFSRYYDRGRQWYVDQFADAPAHCGVVGEVCPDYLQHFVAYTDVLTWLEQLDGSHADDVAPASPRKPARRRKPAA